MDAVLQVGFGLFGLAVLVGITWAFSLRRRAVDWRLVATGTGIGLQIAFAALVLLVPGGRDVFDALGRGFVKVLSFVNEGSSFIFGSLMNVDSYGFIFAFQVLPTLIFFSALMGVLYHLNVMQAVVRAMSWAITKLMRVSGAETTSVCASVFIGQTEAPLTVRPCFPRATPSKIFLTPAPAGCLHHAARSTWQNKHTPCSTWENRVAMTATGNRCEAHTAPRTTPHTSPPCEAWCACAPTQATDRSSQTALDWCRSDRVIDSSINNIKYPIDRKQALTPPVRLRARQSPGMIAQARSASGIRGRSGWHRVFHRPPRGTELLCRKSSRA